MKDSIIKYCVEKKGATEDYPFGPDPLVFKIAGKMFALLSEEKGDYSSLTLKCDPVIAESLREQHEAVLPGYHMNKEHWNTILMNGSLPVSDVFDMIDHSYDMVVKNLPKRLRESILGTN
ncbi:MmcQ/YjbR family DNA-binding protein [Paenibacillus sp. HJL G12]|uniref:MmcQ/YjbR family DNA-binding protein n=1 Tax=Paenibacillus dendrobii TaxID=2691084 RepID=A0A7X3IF79_9BACL|nr:MmcQ/YjbR family DNA-binding protein [Paenibacillus dendrobii]MWV42745.1 MmcQ/YjbR family DNA-binding protein [Paenibacillus dendrobii]